MSRVAPGVRGRRAAAAGLSLLLALRSGEIASAQEMLPPNMSRPVTEPADGRAGTDISAAGSVAVGMPAGFPVAPSLSAFSVDAGAGVPGSAGPLLVSPSVLPQTGVEPAGTEIRLGDLGNPFDRILQQPPALPEGRAYSIVPSIGIFEAYATGLIGDNGTRLRDQFITVLQPGLQARAETSRVQADVIYTPQILLFVPSGSQNQVNQDFNARVLATLVPQTVYLDLRGSGLGASILPGEAIGPASALTSVTTSQLYSVAATPYAVRRFGDWGTGEIGATIGNTAQSATQTGSGSSVLSALAAASNQNATTYGGHLAFVSGQALGRLNSSFLADTTNFSGTGVLRDAYRRTAILDNGYALTQRIIILAAIGYEDLHYTGSLPLTINDAIWNAGVRLIPNDLSSIVVRYGRRDGLDSFLVDASYQVSARIRVFGRYSRGLATTAEELQSVLATTDLDALGNPVDRTTGAPLVPIGTFFGINSNLYRTSAGSFTAEWRLDRDIVTAGMNTQTQTLVSAANTFGAEIGNISGVYGSLSWSHQLRRNIETSVFGLYGSNSNGLTVGSQPLVEGSVAVTVALSPEWTGRAQYTYLQQFRTSSPFAKLQGIAGTQNLILVGLSKSF